MNHNLAEGIVKTDTILINPGNYPSEYRHVIADVNQLWVARGCPSPEPHRSPERTTGDPHEPYWTEALLGECGGQEAAACEMLEKAFQSLCGELSWGVRPAHQTDAWRLFSAAAYKIWENDRTVAENICNSTDYFGALPGAVAESM